VSDRDPDPDFVLFLGMARRMSICQRYGAF
jgi:hypothetical protein